jgi:prophage maintenance system killer protein
MRGSREGIQTILERVKGEEGKGLTYQAALIMKELVSAHIFDGGNHRTAHGVAKMFLRRNGKRL